MKCKYCGTSPNNATRKKGLYVCCCYMLHKQNGEYIQHHKDREPEHLIEEGIIDMTKTKFFREDNTLKLEREVNEFIKDKKIINISYSVSPCGYGYIHCCCVLYNA